jgi:streptomycin 3"-adenylyltransferase
VGNTSDPVRFAEALSADLDAWKSDLVGVYLHGSACLGGWNATTSDVDVLIVVEDTIEHEMLAPMYHVLLARARHCPGTGIECSVVTRSQAGVIRDRWPYLAHINASDRKIPDILPASNPDPDLLAHYAVCREAGIAISGPPAAEVFAPVPRELMLSYLADELIWGLEHAPPRYALLNACRAREFLESDRIVSKIDAGEDALRRRRAGDPLVEIEAALVEQRGGAGKPALSLEAVAFVHGVSQALDEDELVNL